MKVVFLMTLFVLVLTYPFVNGVKVEEKVIMEIKEKFHIRGVESIKEVEFTIPLKEHFSEVEIKECKYCSYEYNGEELIIRPLKITNGNNEISVVAEIVQNLILPYKAKESKERINAYSLPTPEIQSNDERIKTIAEKIWNKCNENAYCFIKGSVEWIHKNMRYDLKYADKNYDALWVLENKVGVCAEYTTLFIALARAINLPARYNSVFAYYKGENKFIPHAYAEIYINGTWYPVDVLWKQIGYVDANHVFRGNSISNIVKSEVNVKYDPSKNIEFKWIKEEYNITLINVESKPLFSLENKSINLEYNQTKTISLNVKSSLKNVCFEIIALVCKGANLTITPSNMIACSNEIISYNIKSEDKRSFRCNITLNYDNTYSIIAVHNKGKITYLEEKAESFEGWLRKLLTWIISFISSL